MKYDLIILGGGVLGLSLACLASREGFSIALVEAKTPTLHTTPNTIDPRCFAISRASQKVFEDLNLWEKFCLEGISPYEKMQVWDALGFGEISFSAEEVAEPNLGHIIENRVMLKALWEEAQNCPNIHLFLDTVPVQITKEKTKVCIELKNGQRLEGSLVVGAEGAGSWLRTTLGMETQKQDYHQTALITHVETEYPHEKTAYQRFLPGGPLAFLPLKAPNLSSIVWTLPSSEAAKNLTLEDKLFCENLSLSLDYRLGVIHSVGERFTFPLFGLHAKTYVEERIALIGDAAHVIHPLAGQGMNLGLQDVKVLHSVLKAAKEKDWDIGMYLNLRKYERARKGASLKMQKSLEALNGLFGSEATPMVTFRSMGLNITNRSVWFKKKLIRQAMGIN